MKQFLFIFLLTCPLWVCSSCIQEDDDPKLPAGTKPEIFFGKWQQYGDLRKLFGPQIGYYLRTYEFTSKGGSITTLEYVIEEGKCREPEVDPFSDWCYDGSDIHFLRKKSEKPHILSPTHWAKSVSDINPDYITLGGGWGTYYRINGNERINLMEVEHCIDVAISGLLQVKTDGTPLVNTPVEVIWAYGVEAPSRGYTIATGNTASDGRFTIQTQLDTLLFKSWRLYISVPSSFENYISLNYSWGRYHFGHVFTHFDRSQLQDMKFDIYHKVDLKIKFIKTSDDSINQFDISYSFEGKNNRAGYGNGFPPDSLTVKTATDVTTTVTFWKIISTDNSAAGSSTPYSLICRKDTDNMIEIEY